MRATRGGTRSRRTFCTWMKRFGFYVNAKGVWMYFVFVSFLHVNNGNASESINKCATIQGGQLVDGVSVRSGCNSQRLMRIVVVRLGWATWNSLEWVYIFRSAEWKSKPTGRRNAFEYIWRENRFGREEKCVLDLFLFVVRIHCDPLLIRQLAVWWRNTWKTCDFIFRSRSFLTHRFWLEFSDSSPQFHGYRFSVQPVNGSVSPASWCHPKMTSKLRKWKHWVAALQLFAIVGVTIFQIQSRSNHQQVLEYQMNLRQVGQFILNVMQIEVTILETVATDVVIVVVTVVFPFAVN